ncbi:MAG: hypothetical protein ACYDAY_01990 [Candidatus Dormibacteria bacterium]
MAQNSRITGYTAVVLLVMLAAEGLTVLRIHSMLNLHALIGFALIPPVLLKLASVMYRFVRYYAGDPAYRDAGPPELLMRLLGPVVVVLTVILFATGVELWLFGLGLGSVWLVAHKGSFVLWFIAMTVHVLGHLQRASQLAVADWRDHLRGATFRRSLVAGSILLGLTLLVAMLAYQTPYPIRPENGP